MYEYNYNKTSLGVNLTLSLSNRLVVVHGHHGGKPGGRRVDLALEQKLGAVAGSLHLICKMEAETARLDLVWTFETSKLIPNNTLPTRPHLGILLKLSSTRDQSFKLLSLQGFQQKGRVNGALVQHLGHRAP